MSDNVDNFSSIFSDNGCFDDSNHCFRVCIALAGDLFKGFQNLGSVLEHILRRESAHCSHFQNPTTSKYLWMIYCNP